MVKLCVAVVVALCTFSSLVITVKSGASPIVKRDVDFAKLNKFNDDLMMMSKLGDLNNANLPKGQRRSDQPETDLGLTGRAASLGGAPAPGPNAFAPLQPILTSAGNVPPPVALPSTPAAITPAAITPAPATVPTTSACSHPKDLKCRKNGTASDVHPPAAALTLGIVKNDSCVGTSCPPRNATKPPTNTTAQPSISDDIFGFMKRMSLWF